MERIGLAASKIAKGNLFLYNCFVVLLTFLFAFLVYFLAGSAIVVVLVFIAYLTSMEGAPNLESGWIPFMHLPLTSLAVVVGLFSLIAIGKNIKFKK